MDLDEEILQRLTNTEDHLTERKSRTHRDQCTEVMVAFANSAMPDKPGILYVGVNDDGALLHTKAPESWQHDLTAWANGCFPELQVIPRTLSKDGKEFLAVVVPLSESRPHFARPAFKREGAKTISAPPARDR
jgi:predicted HTH transcriptional regulator